MRGVGHGSQWFAWCSAAVGAAVAAAVTTGGTAQAAPGDAAPRDAPASGGDLTRQPPRIVGVSSAWLPRSGQVGTSLGVDHRGGVLATVGLGVGGLAHVEVGLDGDTRGVGDKPLRLVRAAFRVGIEGSDLAGRPGVMLGLRNSFLQSVDPRTRNLAATEVTLMAGVHVGPVRLHAGGVIVDAAGSQGRVSLRVRPLAAMEWRPPIYPKTTLIADWGWATDLGQDLRVRGIGSVGARYRVNSRLAVELVVWHRQGEDLAATTIGTRIHALLY